MKGIHHVGVAVDDLDDAISTYERLFGAESRAARPRTSRASRRRRCGSATGHVELLAALGPDTPVGRFLAKRGPGHAPHRLRGRRPDRASSTRLEGEGVRLIDETPRRGLFGTEVAFVHLESRARRTLGAGGTWLSGFGSRSASTSGQVIGALVGAEAADALEQALEAGDDGAFQLDVEDGRYTVVLGGSSTSKRFARDGRVGFGA